MQRGEWRECAIPTCWKLYQVGEGCGIFCSRTCSRAADRLIQSGEALEQALEKARQVDATDLYDRAAMLRLLGEY
jgi:hypothetical protein